MSVLVVAVEVVLLSGAAIILAIVGVILIVLVNIINIYCGILLIITLLVVIVVTSHSALQPYAKIDSCSTALWIT